MDSEDSALQTCRHASFTRVCVSRLIFSDTMELQLNEKPACLLGCYLNGAWLWLVLSEKCNPQPFGRVQPACLHLIQSNLCCRYAQWRRECLASLWESWSRGGFFPPILLNERSEYLKSQCSRVSVSRLVSLVTARGKEMVPLVLLKHAAMEMSVFLSKLLQQKSWQLQCC